MKLLRSWWLWIGALLILGGAIFLVIPRWYGISDYRHDADFPTILKILQDDWYWLVSEDSTDFSPEYTFSHRAFSPTHADGSLTILVYRMHGKPVAFLTYYKVQGCYAVIQFVAVAPEYRRRGYAQALLKHVLENAPKEGVCSFDLTTRVSNESAQRLYKQFGFEQSYLDDGFIGFHKLLLPARAYA